MPDLRHPCNQRLQGLLAARLPRGSNTQTGHLARQGFRKVDQRRISMFWGFLNSGAWGQQLAPTTIQVVLHGIGSRHPWLLCQSGHCALSVRQLHHT
eukprot:2661617-Amphidinium_carterae.1